MGNKVRIGGLMRCCLDTLGRKEPEDAKEEDVLPCDFCGSSMILRGGAWEWNHD